MTTFDRTVYPYISPIESDDSSCDECRAELWVHALDKTSEELRKKIEGDNWPSSLQFKKNRRMPPRYKGTYALVSDKHIKSRDLREHIDWLCDWLERSTGLQSLQKDPNVIFHISCFWWSNDSDGGGFALWPKQMKRLANLQMEIQFHFAYYGDEKETLT